MRHHAGTSHMIHRLFVALAATALLLGAGFVGAAQRFALVIGNDGYRHVERLETARADAKAVAKALERVGFKVMLRLDMDERALKAAVRQFKAQLTANDEAVLFYAGHGVQLTEENLLVPVDAGLDSEDQIKDESVSLSRVLGDLQERQPRFLLAIVDACRNNPFRTHFRSGPTRGLLPVAAATGQMVIYSAGAGQAALDKLGDTDRNPNSVFTRTLLREIGAPGVPVDRVVRRVRDQVAMLARSVGHEQVPAIYDQTIGDFFFVPGRAAGSAMATIGPKLKERLQVLERSKADLTIGQALSIVLEPTTPQDRSRIEQFEANLSRLPDHSAFAIGDKPAGKGLLTGFATRRSHPLRSESRALEKCESSGAKGRCRVVYQNGKLDAAVFIKAVRASSLQDLPAYQSAWRHVLQRVDKNGQYPFQR